MAPVDRITIHHQGAGVPKDSFGFMDEGYCIGIGLTRYEVHRPPSAAWATFGYNHRSLDICLCGNRNEHPVTDNDLALLRAAVQDAFDRGWTTSDADCYPHGTLHPVPAGYPQGNRPTECPGTQTVARWPDVYNAARRNTPTNSEEDMPLNDADKEYIRDIVLDIVRKEGVSGAAVYAKGALDAITAVANAQASGNLVDLDVLVQKIKDDIADDLKS